MDIRRYIFLPLLFILLVASPFLPDVRSSLHKANLFFSVLFLVASGFVFSISRNKEFVIKLTRIDVIAFLYLLWIGIRALLTPENTIDSLWVCEWLFLVILYVSVKNSEHGSTGLLLYALVVSGVLQAAVGLMQLHSIIPSRDEYFLLTGSFGNPGPLGGYESLALTGCVWLLKNAIDERAFGKVLFLILSGCLIGYVMILSDSRAAWVAVLAGGIYGISYGLKLNTSTRLLTSLLLLLVTGLSYTYRPASAQARLLIWEVSTVMFQDRPLIGHGPQSFSRLYMKYQGEYFKRHPRSDFITVADNNDKAFNEYVRLGCEFGLVGLLLFLLLIGHIFISKNRKEVDTELRTLILVFLVFSFFSYPAEILSLKIWFVLFISRLSFPPLHICNVTKTPFLKVSTLTAMSVLALFLFQTGKIYGKAGKELQQGEPSRLLYANRYFMQRYAAFLFRNKDYVRFINMVEQETFPVSNSEILCDLGTAYFYEHKYDKAEEYYIQASHMVPSRIAPLYGLFLLYVETNNHRQATVIAQKILSLKVKMVNSVTLRVKQIAQKYLTEQ